MLRHRKDQCNKIQYPITIHNSSALLTYLAIHQGQVLPWWQHLFVSQSMLGKKINRFFKASELQAEEWIEMGSCKTKQKIWWTNTINIRTWSWKQNRCCRTPGPSFHPPKKQSPVVSRSWYLRSYLNFIQYPLPETEKNCYNILRNLAWQQSITI